MTKVLPSVDPVTVSKLARTELFQWFLPHGSRLNKQINDRVLTFNQEEQRRERQLRKQFQEQAELLESGSYSEETYPPNEPPSPMPGLEGDPLPNPFG